VGQWKGALVVFVVSSALSTMLSAARRTQAKRLGGEYFFPPSWIAEVAMTLGAAMALCFLHLVNVELSD